MRKETLEAINLLQGLRSEGKLPERTFDYLIRLAIAIEVQCAIEQMMDTFFRRAFRVYSRT